MSRQLQLPLVTLIHYKLPLRVVDVERSGILVRIVDAEDHPVCLVLNRELAEHMCAGANAYQEVA